MKRDKLLIIIALIITLVICTDVVLYMAVSDDTPESSTETTGSVSEEPYYFKTHGMMFSVLNEDTGEFEDIYMKGVNVGAGKPGYFPGESAITFEEYRNWFQEIADMNANCIRVYTIQSPAFYKALYYHNQVAEDPLYFFQGTWYDEDSITNTWNAYDEYLYSTLIQDEEDIVDAIHGNITIEERTGKAYGEYICDVSKYCIGWVLGIESEAEFVMVTNEKNPEKTSYEGTYLTCQDVSPFETFWAETGDHILGYEMEKYQMQRPISFTNWPTTDVIQHPSISSDPLDNGEDCVSLTVENIKPTEAFQAGIFASYHIYPYYPNFMYTDQAYADYIDEDGKHNTYEAYLKDLIQYHTVPVLVAEFGVPASRGMAHVNEVTEVTQGRISEETQGEYLIQMAEDIKECGYCGELIFSWQDEWFKKTWNTEENTNKDRRAVWDDIETNEQSFGLVDYRANRRNIVLDGNKDDWYPTDLFSLNQKHQLSVTHDEAYLYLYVSDLDLETEQIVIGFDVSKDVGAKDYEGYHFENDVDFLLQIDGFDHTRLLVHKDYDRLRYEFKDDDDVYIPYLYDETKEFNPVYRLMERIIPFEDREGGYETRYYEAGLLTYGTEAELKQLADFCATEDGVEIRIPWSLLNFRDPSTKEVETSFQDITYSKEQGFSGTNINGIGIGLGPAEEDTIRVYSYEWDNWNQPIYTEQLKDSYYMIQEYYGGIN